MSTNNKHIGSSFNDFLKEEGVYEEVNSVAATRVIAWQIQEAMKEMHVSKQQMAKRMHTSRTQVDRLLNPHNTSIQVGTLHKAAAAVGKRLVIALEPIA
jgi:hypothetical protein